MLLNKTIRLFLDSIGRREEYEYYLERFRSDDSKAFALLCPLSAGFDDAASVFAFDLEFLLRLELAPVILLCGPDAGRMRELLFAGSHPFAAFPINVDGPHVEDPSSRILDFLQDCRRRSRVMVLVDPSTPLEDALQRLVPLVSRRVHFIRVGGGLHDAAGEPLNYYYLRQPEVATLAQPDRALVDLAGHLLARDAGAHISVASPLQLLEELFTVKGAGCLIRTGSMIHEYSNWCGTDTERLVALLERSFGRALVSRKFLDRVSNLYIEEAYRGAALLEPHADAMYLSKFAVDEAARGEGLAIELWRAVTRNHKALFWRSRVRNPINHWYEKQADGHHRTGEWRIFWRGVRPDDIPSLIAFALNQEEDFSPVSTAT
jgi:ribosomal protein S18 acetylase RimI-like enzyme